MEQPLEAKLALLPSSPGVYLMKGSDAAVLYVGKAKDLKKRVSSYFASGRQKDLKTVALLHKVIDIETILTLSEKEALILESNLIKKHRPHYNVVLRDDKRYPWIRLDIKSQYPNLSIIRKPAKDGALYFGPFDSGLSVRITLKLIDSTFRLRKCKGRPLKSRERPCLNHQMGLCMGPCGMCVSHEAYAEQVAQVILLLKGRMPELIKQVEAKMHEAAERHAFEEAAEHRNRLFALSRILEKQVAATADFEDRDVVGFAREHAAALIMVLFVRGGYVLGNKEFFFPETFATDDEAVASFIKQYYDGTSFLPKEILALAEPEDKELLEEALSELKGEKVSILSPQRGDKARLLEIAEQNAKKALGDRLSLAFAQDSVLDQVRKHLDLSRLPKRIECFDLSNLSGSESVGAMVVFENGKPLRDAYRKYKIKSSPGSDDYAMLGEVLARRYSNHSNHSKRDEGQKLPDLAIVDGGKGQLGVALRIFESLKIAGAFDLIAIAKKDSMAGETEDKIFKPNRKNPLTLSRHPEVLLFIQRIRDEAHRHVITYQRKRRLLTYRRSPLEDIPGIGPKRRTSLLKHFGSLRRIQQAAIEELSSAPGMDRNTAQSVWNALHGASNDNAQ